MQSMEEGGRVGVEAGVGAAVAVAATQPARRKKKTNRDVMRRFMR
jgi:hypothetical protein